ncbi:MAG: tetratricopeptide repeat protein [Sinimarinibacterium sp.]|jgi:Flp pilus assembly protein TadD
MAAVIGACAMPQRVDAPEPEPAQSQRNVSETRRVYSDLIRSMLEQGQYYAALAHVQERRHEGGDQGELRYLEAEARRGLGQVDAADALYRGLLRAPQAARAYHGLGLLHAGHDLNRAIGYLGEAARRVPTDADVRNDFGYALLRAGRYPEALAELATAVELAPESEKARNNLILLLLVRGDEAAVTRVAREAAVAPDTLSRLRQQARALNTPKGIQGG